MAIVTPRPQREKKLIHIENSRFIFNTNFAGDPEKDRFGSDARQANLVIPSYEQAMELLDMGLKVKQTNPRPGEEEDYQPTYFVAIKANYDSDWPPKIHLVSGDSDPVLLDEESVGRIDKCYVLNVDAVLNIYENSRTGTKSLYVRTMYVTQDVEDDPFAAKYARN